MHSIILLAIISKTTSLLPSVFQVIPISDEDLFNQQIILSTILEESTSTEEALNNLNNSILANSQWQIEKWNSDMVDTAMKIAKKWKKA